MLETDSLWPEPVGWDGLVRYVLAILVVPVTIAVLILAFFAFRYIAG